MGLFTQGNFGELKEALIKTPFVLSSNFVSLPPPPPTAYFLLDDSSDDLLDDSGDNLTVGL